MTSYEAEHATYAHEQREQRSELATGNRLSRADPNLASFFSSSFQRPQAEAYQGLAEAMRLYEPGAASLMSNMINQLLGEAASGKTEQGVDQTFLDSLDRVSKTSLQDDDACPICASPYLEDTYPLVISLRCKHKFDLECITPWLKLHTTCPMCRAQVQQTKTVPVKDDSEEEYDDTYG